MRVGIIRNKDFYITALTLVVHQRTWDLEYHSVQKAYRAKTDEIVAVLFIVFCGVLRK